MNRETALVVFSGGQDSTTCLFWAKRNFKKVYALSFLYGQKHQKEVELAREIARKAEVEFDVMDVSFIGTLGHNSLTDTTMVMDQEKPAGSVPNTFVPGRNLFFLSIAAVYARERGINHLVTGVSQTDFSGYPDCRDAFIKSLNVTLNLAMDEQFVIHTPLMWIDKISENLIANNYVFINNEPKSDINILGLYSWGDFGIDPLSAALVVGDVILGGPTGEGIGPAIGFARHENRSKNCN